MTAQTDHPIHPHWMQIEIPRCILHFVNPEKEKKNTLKWEIKHKNQKNVIVGIIHIRFFQFPSFLGRSPKKARKGLEIDRSVFQIVYSEPGSV